MPFKKKLVEPAPMENMAQPSPPKSRRKPTAVQVPQAEPVNREVQNLSDLYIDDRKTQRQYKAVREKDERDLVKIGMHTVMALVAILTIFTGAALTTLPNSAGNVVWLHAENAALAVMLVLVYIKK